MVDQNRDPALDEALELFFYGFRAFTALPDQVLAQRVFVYGNRTIIL